MDLRPYQVAAVEEVCAKIDQAPLLVAPTGAGKTVMVAAILRRLDCSALVVAHRREIIHQAARSFRDAGCVVGLIMAGERPVPDAPVQVASVQTLARRDLPDADVLVIDEAHHATAAGYQRLTAAYARRVGATATPFRLDGKGLGAAGFGSIVVAAWTDDLCRDGFLHEPVVYAAAKPDLSGVKVVAGDFAHGQLSARMNQAGLVGNVIENWKRRAEGRRTVCFAVGVEHAQALAARWTVAGVAAEVVTGETPRDERDATLARLAAGETTVVVNCMVLTEGWDLPALECAVIARPTASLNLHLQTIGRVMRAAAGKDGAIVLDHAGNWHRHGSVTKRLVYSLESPVREEAGTTPTKLCPSCARVVKRSANPCPGCGYVFSTERDMNPAESDAVLERVTAPAVLASFDERARAWRQCWAKAYGIVAQRNGRLLADDEQKGVDDVLDMAASMFQRRFGSYPMAHDSILLDPATAGFDAWANMRRRWRRIGMRKGWPSHKIEWFARKSEAEMRATVPAAVAS
jgi:DNA repair protein RadD